MNPQPMAIIYRLMACKVAARQPLMQLRDRPQTSKVRQPQQRSFGFRDMTVCTHSLPNSSSRKILAPPKGTRTVFEWCPRARCQPSCPQCHHGFSKRELPRCPCVSSLLALPPGLPTSAARRCRGTRSAPTLPASGTGAADPYSSALCRCTAAAAPAAVAGVMARTHVARQRQVGDWGVPRKKVGRTNEHHTHNSQLSYELEPRDPAPATAMARRRLAVLGFGGILKRAHKGR